MDPAWSPDSRWLAYSKRLDNLFHVVMVHSLADGKSHQLTDGLSDALHPAWDGGGKYLFFLASTDYGLNTGWVDMSSYERPNLRSAYVMVLRKSDPSPFLPESDEEKGKPAADTAKAKPDTAKGKSRADSVRVQIDFDGLSQRILALEPDRRNRAILRLLYAGGLRRSELVGLRWRDPIFDRHDHRPTVRHSPHQRLLLRRPGARRIEIEILRLREWEPAPEQD